MKSVGVVVLAAVFALLARPASAEPTYPDPTGYVTDAAGALRQDTVDDLRRDLDDYQARTSNELSVAVVNTTGGLSIEEYANTLFNRWGVGKMASNNGALLVVAVEDRHLRLEVGDGLREKIGNERARQIVDERILPRLRDGDLDGGVVAGMLGVREALGDDVRTFAGRPAPGPAPVDSPVYDSFPLQGTEEPDEPFPWGPVVLGGGGLLGAVGVGLGVRRSRYLDDRCPSCGSNLQMGNRRLGYADSWFSKCDSCRFSRSAWGGGGGGWSGTSFGGGSWGSSSSSSSSSSSGSRFGGGHSSGGGASGSW